MLSKIFRNKNQIFISSLFIISLFIRLFFLPKLPIYGDEAVYAEIIDEFIRKPTILPTFLGHVIAWKPPLTFIVYSFFIRLFSLIIPNAPVEITYRLPSVIFGVLSVLALYFLVKKLYDEESAFISALIFSVSNITILTNELLLLDSLVVFLLLVGIIFYIDAERNPKYFYLAGLSGVLLFLTKTFIGFMLPLLGIAYYLNSKEIKKDKRMIWPFIFSIIAVPLTMAIYAILFYFFAPKVSDINLSYLYDMLRIVGEKGIAPTFISNLNYFFNLFFPWSLIPFAGLIGLNIRKKNDALILVWAALVILPLMANLSYFWYYPPVLPSFCALCAKGLIKIKRPIFIAAVFLIFYLISLPYFSKDSLLLNILNIFPNYNVSVESEKSIGTFLQNQTEILTMTDQGIPGVVFYKFHYEQNPEYLKFIQIVTDPGSPAGYIAFEFAGDIFSGKAYKDKLNLTKAEEINWVIRNSKFNNHVLMNKRIYGIYLREPLQNYKIAYSSSDAELFIISKIQS